MKSIMRNKIIYIVIIIINICTLKAIAGQTYWSKTYGSIAEDMAFSIQQTSDSGFIVAGSTNSFCKYGMDLLILKTDPEGNVQWAKTYGRCDSFLQDEKGRSILETSDGGYIVAGSLYSPRPPGSDVWIIKLDVKGEIQWQKTFGGTGEDDAYSILPALDGSYFILAVTSSFGAGSADIWVLKLDRKGNVQWQKTYGTEMYEEPWAMVRAPDNQLLIAGYANLPGLKSDPILMLIDEQGNVIWQKRYSAYECDRAFAVDSFNDGYVIAGYTASHSAGGRDFLVTKTDLSGNIVWQNAYGGKDHEEAYRIKKTDDGGYIVLGDTLSFGAGSYDLWIMKLDANGSVLWGKTFGGYKNDYGRDIQLLKNGSFIVAGFTESYGFQSTDLWLLKLDSLGNIAHPFTCCLHGNSHAIISTESMITYDYNAQVHDSICALTDTHVNENNVTFHLIEQCSDEMSIDSIEPEVVPMESSSTIRIKGNGFNQNSKVILKNQQWQVTVPIELISEHELQFELPQESPVSLMDLCVVSNQSSIKCAINALKYGDSSAMIPGISGIDRSFPGAFCTDSCQILKSKK